MIRSSFPFGWLALHSHLHIEFSVGYDAEATRQRSINEAVERWAWSKWIDEKKSIPTYSAEHLTDIARFFYNKFQSIQFYRKEIEAPLFPSGVGTLVIAICCDSRGVFVGSKLGEAGEIAEGTSRVS